MPISEQAYRSSPISTGLVGAKTCIEAVFPDPKTRIGLRFFWALKAQGKLPYLKIGRRILFDPSQVRAALDKQFLRRVGK
jgi:hypothetical protein